MRYAVKTNRLKSVGKVTHDGSRLSFARMTDQERVDASKMHVRKTHLPVPKIVMADCPLAQKYGSRLSSEAPY